MSDGWALDPESLERALARWISRENPTDTDQNWVRAWIEHLREDPGAGEGHESGVVSAYVPETDVAVIWTLDTDNLAIVVAHIGTA